MAAKIIKLVGVLFSVLAVLACGCGKHSGRKGEIQTDFSAAFTAEYRGLSLKGNVLSTRQGVCVIDLEQPETLGGLGFHYKDNVLEISRDGIKATADEAYLPGEGFPSLLHEALQKASAGDYTPAQEEHTYSLSLQAGEGLLTVDGSGYPKRLAADSAECVVSFAMTAEGEK